MDLGNESTRSVLGRLDPLYVLTAYPHTSAVCHNLHSDVPSERRDFNSHFNLFGPHNYAFSYPLPFTHPRRTSPQVVAGMDPALSLVREKQVWEDQKKHLMKVCSKKYAEKNSDQLESVKNMSLPFSYLRLADHMSKDPDEHFSNIYNTYYIGGNISSVTVGLKSFLTVPAKSEDGDIIVMESLDNNDVESAQLTNIAGRTGLSSPVFQIETLEDNLICRQKNRISIFKFEEGDDLQLYNAVNKISVDGNIPYFSVGLTKNLFCSTNADRKLEIFDMYDGSPILHGDLEKEEGMNISDNWSSAYFIDQNVICFIDRTSVGFVDIRERISTSAKWDVSVMTEHCEEVCCAAAGGSQSHYIVSSHQLLHLDPRIGFTQRWTHGILHPPAYISVSSFQTGSDKIFIGSQMSDEVVFIENNCENDLYVSRSQPYLLPNLSDTLHAARFNGTCLGNVVAPRYSMCLTGLHLFEHDSGLDVFRLTSAGDIFKQSVKKAENCIEIELNDESINKLDSWEAECEEIFHEDRKNCVVSNIYEDSHVRELTTSTRVYDESRKKIDTSKQSWSISKKELESYCDYLAPKLLKEWDLDQEEEWAPLVPDHSVLSDISTSDDEEDVFEKVAKWMETYNRKQEDNKEEDDDVYIFDEENVEDAEEVLFSDSEIPPEEPKNIALPNQEISDGLVKVRAKPRWPQKKKKVGF